MIVDEKTQLKWSDFFKTKDEMVEPTCMLFKEWKDFGKPLTHLRMDNAGENMALIERCKSADWKLGIKKFELTARDTPQQNSPVEDGFGTLYNRARAFPHKAHIPDSKRYLFIPKAINLATDLDALMVIEVKDETKTRFEHFHNEQAKYSMSLKTFGEAGVVKLRTKTSPKILDKGDTCIFVGYPKNHGSDCWIMFNPKTNGEHVTRDVVWLCRMYYNIPKETKEIVVPVEEEKETDIESEGE
jgi:hypothetical protein